MHPEKSSFKVPEEERMGVVDLFPFLSAANSLHPESLAFSTVCFSQELKFSSTFRKHELHKQGAFLALLLGSPQVCVGAHMSTWASCSGLGLPFLLCVSGSLSHSPSPWPYPLLFHPFPTDQFLNSPLFSDLLETCSMASLK